MTPQQIFRGTLAALAALATGYVLLMSIHILIVLLLAIIVASATRPLIARLVHLHIPHGIAILMIYGGLALSILVVAFAVLTPIGNQIADYLQNDRRLSNRVVYTKTWIETTAAQLVGHPVNLGDDEQIRTTIENMVNGIRTAVPDMADDLGGALGDAVLVFVMGVYWITSREKAIEFITQMAASTSRPQIRDAMNEIEVSMGSYIRGTVFVATVIGLANFIILMLFRVPNAATYAFIVGITTMLPVVGGLIGGTLATLLALLTSPINGLIVFGTFVAVQQIEVHYLTPTIQSRSIGADPLLVMVAVFVGFAIYGVIGAIISIPLLGTVSILLRYFVIEPRKEEVSDFEVEDGVMVLKANEDISAAQNRPAIFTAEGFK